MNKKKSSTSRSKVNGPVRPRKPRRGARSQSLPGFEQVRNQRLDNICEAIGDERERMNEAETEERSLVASALESMQKAQVQVYKHNGVELARVPGAEKLRVRLVKEQGNAQVETGVVEAQSVSGGAEREVDV